LKEKHTLIKKNKVIQMEITLNKGFLMCREGKCVDISHNNCEYAFDELDNQIECEELQRNI